MPTLIENGTLADNIRLCKELNLRFLELNMNFPEYQLHRLEQTDDFCRAAEEAGLYYTIHLDENLNPADFNPLVANAYLETVKRGMGKKASRLSSICICTMGFISRFRTGRCRCMIGILRFILIPFSNSGHSARNGSASPISSFA